MNDEQLSVLMKLFEDSPYQEEPGGSVSHDGSKYDLNMLFKATAKQPLAYLKIADLEWILEEGDDEERTEAADLKSPILVTEWKNKWVVLDGFHRLQKAVSKDIEELAGRIVSAEQLEQAKVK